MTAPVLDEFGFYTLAGQPATSRDLVQEVIDGEAMGFGSVFISEPTHRIVGDFFDCEALGDLPVKGKVQPVQAWRVLREKPLRTRIEVAAEHGLSRFVGRDDELAVLDGYVVGLHEPRGALPGGQLVQRRRSDA